MKVGIIIHNPNGKEAKIARSLKRQFKKNGHDVFIEEIITTNQNQEESNDIRLTTVPSIEEYQSIVFGAPIIDGKLSTPMVLYLKQLDKIEDDKICTGFLTQFSLRFNKGFKDSGKMLKDLCGDKNINMRNVQIFRWLNPFIRNF